MFVLRNTIPRIIRHSNIVNLVNYQSTQFYCKQVKLNKKLENLSDNKSDHDDRTVTDVNSEIEEYKKKKQKEDEEWEAKRKATHHVNLMVQGDFSNVGEKNRETFLTMINIFEQKGQHRRNHVEFIYAALKNMKDFGVVTDLEVYKALIDVLPKGKFIARNMFQAEFMYYPKQQQCIIDVLEQMEDWGVIPDYEMEDILLNIFGRRAHPVYKFWRMMYWMPKFKNASPWLLPKPVPDEPYELALLGVKQMCSVDPESKIETWNTKDVKNSIDDTWIVTGQSLEQRKLLATHPDDAPLRVEGPFIIWLRTRSLSYFILRGNPISNDEYRDNTDEDDVSNLLLPKFLRRFTGDSKTMKEKIAIKQSIHQQDDGTIYAICATGTSTKDSLLSWVRLLEKTNPILTQKPVLFKFISNVDDQLPAVIH